MQFTTYVVGRGENADIHLSDSTVSRYHLEITMTSDKRLYAIDANSSASTFIWKNDNWEKLKQGFVKENDYLSLGKKKVKVQKLMQEILVMGLQENASFEPITIKPVRSASGEVIL